MGIRVYKKLVMTSVMINFFIILILTLFEIGDSLLYKLLLLANLSVQPSLQIYFPLLGY
ncbi:hypothetical protein SAMN04487786_2494 [Paenisporosarcina quisquiliarum]|nr:hypothetical protein SAMN04487786_2494 [Paenisporosarcina quisquiliarum]